ncbi:MAG: type IV secretion protein IcmD [Legionellales bacterium]|nr:MAG: type IV secretion protein IcmD [Legionellales bacterium]
MQIRNISLKKLILPVLAIIGVSLLLCEPASAAAGSGKNVQDIANGVKGQLGAIAELLVMAAYVSGVGFSLMGIVQFKAHKDNPQQVPLSKPIVYLIIAACLLFLPSIMESAGQTVFAGDQESASEFSAGGSSS